MRVAIAPGAHVWIPGLGILGTAAGLILEALGAKTVIGAGSSAPSVTVMWKLSGGRCFQSCGKPVMSARSALRTRTA